MLSAESWILRACEDVPVARAFGPARPGNPKVLRYGRAMERLWVLSGASRVRDLIQRLRALAGHLGCDAFW